MTFGQLVDRGRLRCLENLSAAISAARVKARQVIPEPTPRIPNGEIAFAPDGLKLPLRYDFVAEGQDGNWETGNGETTTLQFSDPVVATWEGKLKIEIAKFAWDYLCFTVSPPLGGANWQLLKDWYLRWFDIEDSNGLNEKGFRGVVHFVSDPVTADEGFQYFVDLGSAPTTSLEGLFDTLIKMGFSKCKIG